MGYVCILGDESDTVTMLQTNLKNGATVALCDEHLVPAYIGALASELGVEADALYAAIKRFVDREAAKEAKAVAAEAQQLAKGADARAAAAADDAAELRDRAQAASTETDPNKDDAKDQS